MCIFSEQAHQLDQDDEDLLESQSDLSENSQSVQELPEMQVYKTLKVVFHHANKKEPVIYNISLPKQSTVKDVLDEIKIKATLSPDAELRLVLIFHHKIYLIYSLSVTIENISDQYWTLRAEEIPEEQKNLSPQDRLINAYHFTKDVNQTNFGEPFFLIIYENETLADVKVRIQEKFQVSDEEFSKWKFVHLTSGNPQYLQDSDVIYNRFQQIDDHFNWMHKLGLEHSNTTS